MDEETRIPFSLATPFSRGKAKRRRLRRPKKKANPASLRSAAPSTGRGSRGHSLLPMEGGAPKGRRLDGESGMKERGDCLKYAVCESTRAPPKKEANSASLRSSAPSKGRGLRGHSLLPMEGGAPKGRRLDGESGMKKSGEIISGRRFTKASSERKKLIKPIYSYTKRKSNAANDSNVIYRSGCR